MTLKKFTNNLTTSGVPTKDGKWLRLTLDRQQEYPVHEAVMQDLFQTLYARFAEELEEEPKDVTE